MCNMPDLMEIELYDFARFFPGRLEAPLLESVHRRIDQEGAAPDYFCGRHASISRDRCLDLDPAGYIHLLRERWVFRDNLVFHFAPHGFCCGFLSLSLRH